MITFLVVIGKKSIKVRHGRSLKGITLSWSRLRQHKHKCSKLSQLNVNERKSRWRNPTIITNVMGVIVGNFERTAKRYQNSVLWGVVRNFLLPKSVV